jgi:LPXTG cell wall anchor motif
VKFLRTILTALFLSFVLCTLSVATKADNWDKKTTLTFDNSFEVPGSDGPIVLPAGTYVFKLLDSRSDRAIVQIFDKDQAHLYATVLAITDFRRNATGKTVITFAEGPEGAPVAIKTWFYPGENYGREFVYPKARAVELAKSTNEPVLSTEANNSAPINNAQEPAAQAFENAPVRAEKPSGEEVESGEIIIAQEPAQNTLPKTASEMPLAALGGMLLIGLGLGLRLLSRKAA